MNIREQVRAVEISYSLGRVERKERLGRGGGTGRGIYIYIYTMVPNLWHVLNSLQQTRRKKYLIQSSFSLNCKGKERANLEYISLLSFLLSFPTSLSGFFFGLFAVARQFVKRICKIHSLQSHKNMKGVNGSF